MDQISQSINLLLTISVSLLFATASFQAVIAQSDSLILDNGNLIVGEIKGLDKDILQMKTEYGREVFRIKWEEVSEIYSSSTYIVTIYDGSRIHSGIRSDPDTPQQVIIGVGPYQRIVKLSDLVSILPIEERSLGRFSATVSIGFNRTKNNNLRQFSSRLGLRYEQDSWNSLGFFDMVTSSRNNTEDFSRIHGLILAHYYLKQDWFLIAYTDLLSNEEQQLQLRSVISAGIGKFLVYNNRARLNFSGGGVINSETFKEGIESNRSQELFLGGLLDMFNVGDFSIFAKLLLYPGISESGRFRSDFKFDLKYNLILSFYVKLGYTLNYDNQPVEGASETDYVLQTTLGWHFK
jgi:putative salt-induced outer membrane protein YdiY